MRKIFRAATTVNLFGAIGYMLLVTVWVFVGVIVVALAFDPSVQTIPTETTPGPAAPSSSSEPSPILVVAGYAITVLMAAISVFVIVTLPYVVGKWGGRLLRRLMLLVRIPITRRQLFLTKCIIVTLPLVKLMIINFTLMPESMVFGAMYIATVAIAAASITMFLLQLVIARRLGISADQAW